MFAVLELGADVDVVDTGRQNRASYVQHLRSGLDRVLKVSELLRQGGDEKVADMIVLEDARFCLVVWKTMLKDPEEAGGNQVGVRERGKGVPNVPGRLYTEIPANAAR